jgi:hypothetical protein
MHVAIQGSLLGFVGEDRHVALEYDEVHRSV